MPAKRFVLDASVAVEWFLPSGGPGGRYAEGILERIGGEELVPAVPDLWHYELGSVLIAARRDKRISAAKLRASQLAIRGLQLEMLAIEIDAAALVDISQLSSSRVRRGLFRTCAPAGHSDCVARRRDKNGMQTVWCRAAVICCHDGKVRTRYYFEAAGICSR